MATKTCTKCQNLLTLDQFNKDCSKKDGLSCSCKSCISKQSKKRYAKNKGFLIKKSKEWHKTNREKYLYSMYKKRDEKAKVKFDLTIEWIKNNIITKECIYCGDTDQLGCDRIDNSKGHTMDNCVPCCYSCNITRNNTYSYGEMLLLAPIIRQIKENRKGV